MKSLHLAASAALMSILACSAPTAAADPLLLTDIRWTAEPAGGKQAAAQLRIEHRKSTSSTSLDGARAHFAEAQTMLARHAPGPVSFRIAHAAGTLSCSGHLVGAFDGRGTCRFTSDPAFETALGERGLAPRQRSTLLAMLLVDASIDLADGLAREGVKPRDADDLIAAAALDVRPEYIRDLKSDALVLTDVDDAVACKALGVDGNYVRALAAAGYNKLSANDVVSMKALGVTGDYAAAMNRAAREAAQ